MEEWERQERRVAKRTGGKRQPGSGSGWVHSNDVKDDEYLREMKQTNGKSISIKLEDWEKLRRNALMSGRKPAMHLQIGKRRLVVFDEGDFIG
jgi:Holliday junction resolvase